MKVYFTISVLLREVDELLHCGSMLALSPSLTSFKLHMCSYCLSCFKFCTIGQGWDTSL